MILNSGLDAACTTDARPGSGSGSDQAWPMFCSFLEYAAIGTGSTTPDPLDTSLDAQAGSRTNSRGGFSNSEDAGLDSGSNTIWYEATFTRAFSIGANINATEWGLAPAASGNLSVRDLFRADPNDDQSSPITLTLEDGDQLQLVVTLRVEAAWAHETKSFVITGTAGNDTNGTHDGNATVSSGAATTLAAIRETLQAVWPGGKNPIGNPAPSTLHVWTSDNSSVDKDQNMNSSSAAQVSMVNESYSAGAFYRDCTGTFTTSAANGDHYAWCCSDLTSASSAGRGYRFILTDPPFLTKQNTHRLTLTVRKSIARL